MSSKEQKCEFGFLAKQADEARVAMANAGSDLARNLGVALSPRLFFKEHKWAFLGVPAIGAGGIATAILGFLFLRKKKHKSRGLFARLFGSIPEPETRRQPEKKIPWWAFILEHAFAVVQPALFSAIASVVSTRFAHHGDGHAQNPRNVR